jgi:hypothetical protein
MSRGKAIGAATVAAGAFLACDKEPVEPNSDPQLTIAAESIAVNLSLQPR